ncbi:hypothetical protein YC2023_075027 [Brassica napus]
MNDACSNIRVPGRKSVKPPGSWTKVHPTIGFLNESSSNHWVPRRKPIHPLGLIVAYLRGKIAMLHTVESGQESRAKMTTGVRTKIHTSDYCLINKVGKTLIFRSSRNSAKNHTKRKGDR